MCGRRRYYFPKQTADEVLLITTYDSEEEPYIPTLHAAFTDPDTPPGAPPRKSIEVRCLCLIPMPPGQPVQYPCSDLQALTRQQRWKGITTSR